MYVCYVYFNKDQLSCELVTHSVTLLHDSAPVRKSEKFQAAVLECGFQATNRLP